MQEQEKEKEQEEQQQQQQEQQQQQQQQREDLKDQLEAQRRRDAGDDPKRPQKG
jgi:hypothetical protein